MEAAAGVIAERGFESATMAEIAARAGAQIGSLYRFFPNKEALADALIYRYGEIVREAFEKIEARASALSVHDLADALLNVLFELHGESQTMVALLEARSEWSVKRNEFRRAAVQYIARILTLRAPHLRPDTVEDVAVVLLHTMKTLKALTIQQGVAINTGAPAELREMTRLYLASKFGEK
ncbi:TetR/AcrR family transcriptional regulator [Frigoriglobus tundricola]|nr:TetR/AcrR family transcriptional regulator [Frigoriglobus tundricola]